MLFFICFEALSISIRMYMYPTCVMRDKGRMQDLRAVPFHPVSGA